MKKLLLFVVLFSFGLFSGCELLESEEQPIDQDNLKLYEINDVFQAKYQSQKAYTEQNSFDEVGKKDLAVTEANLAFLNELLNEGVACREYDVKFDQLAQYFPWYVQMIDFVNMQVAKGNQYSIDEFCYSNITGVSLYAYIVNLDNNTKEYVLNGYLRSGVEKNYDSLLFEQDFDCKINDWTEDKVDWSCVYKKGGEVIEDKYSYDFFFEAAALNETCNGEGESQVCEPAIAQ